MSDTELRKLDREQREITSKANYTLTRTPGPVGGYRIAAVTDPAVQDAANLPISERAKTLNRKVMLQRISSAEQQVVAGMNYRLCLDVTIDGAPDTALAIVYRNLKQQSTLTSWKAGGCEK